MNTGPNPLRNLDKWEALSQTCKTLVTRVWLTAGSDMKKHE